MVFYTAFGTKAGLLSALAEREAERWIDEALTRSDPDPIAWLDATGLALLEAAVARPHHRDLVLAPGPAASAEDDAGADSPTGSDVATTPGAATTLGAAVEDAVQRAWPGDEADAGPIAASVWAAWRGALTLGDPVAAAQVHAGTLRLWAAAVREARRAEDVVP
jgi:AcrR family transcriptional regulator